MSKPESCTGIVLAGGQSKRMGTDKGLVYLNNKPLVLHAVDALSSFCGRIIICSNNEAYLAFGYSLVKDIYSKSGPMAGIHAGLKASFTDDNFILSCDMPFADMSIFSSIIEQHKKCKAVVSVCQSQIIPVCAYYNKSILPDLEMYLNASKLKMMSFLDEIGFLKVHFDSETDIRKLRNINTKDDLLK